MGARSRRDGTLRRDYGSLDCHSELPDARRCGRRGFTLTSLVSRPAPVRAADDAKGVAFFEEKIRPILRAELRSAATARRSTRATSAWTPARTCSRAARTKDKPIKVVELGNPEKSPLIEAVEYKNEDIQMPPPKKKVSQKLSDDKIAALKEWIKMGCRTAAKPVMAEKR